MSIRCDVREGSILLPRPLHELQNYITHFHIPDLFVLARAVKVCALAIFRWHFYDTDSVLLASTTGYIHQLDGEIDSLHRIPSSRPYIIASGTVFSPRENLFYNKIAFSEVKKLNFLSLTNVVSYLGTFNPEFNKGTLPWNHPNYVCVS